MDRRRTDATPTVPEMITVERLRAEADHYHEHPDVLYSLLQDVLGRDDERLASYAGERSYHHPNGFAKITLRKPAPETTGLRLHVWPERSRSAALPTDPHAHRWAFASWIIAGELHEVTFRESSGIGEPYRRYQYSGSAGGTRPSADEQRNLTEIGRHTRGTGDLYIRYRHEIHSVEQVGGMLCASLVVREPDEDSTTPVYQRAGRSGGGQRVRIHRAELRSLLENVCRILRPAI